MVNLTQSENSQAQDEYLYYVNTHAANSGAADLIHCFEDYKGMFGQKQWRAIRNHCCTYLSNVSSNLQQKLNLKGSR